MKLMTLNTHSLIEENGEVKRQATAQFIHENEIDIIALQEVNQTHDAKAIKPCSKYFGSSTIKKDNYANDLVKDLRKLGSSYYWCWFGFKLGYDRYDEGLAILSKYPILDIKEIPLSSVSDYNNWKTRKALGIKVLVNNEMIRIFSVHMGWWDDVDEPFAQQWKKLDAIIREKDDLIFLMGDFNASSKVKNESYDMVMNSNYYDMYHQATKVKGHDTMLGKIDGWSDKKIKGKRIDYIFTNKEIQAKEMKVVFTGKEQMIVSDHFGIYLNIDE